MKFLWQYNLFYPQKSTKEIEAILRPASFLRIPPQLSIAVREGWGEHCSRTDSSSLKVNDNLSQSHAGSIIPNCQSCTATDAEKSWNSLCV